jgi:GH15 family glucan-1,4-alpha-glucosidase
MENYFHWLMDVMAEVDGGHLQPVYGIDLERTLSERVIAHLPGYRSAGPVRVGNQAHEHFQHDVYGNVILGAVQTFFDTRLAKEAGAHDFRLMEAIGNKAYELYNQPDAGMWELRSRAAVHTSSSLMCWAACDRLAKIAAHLGEAGRVLHWRGRAEEIKRFILDNTWSEKRKAFVDSPGSEHLDASMLLMAEVGFISPNDPRFVSTVEALEKTLARGPHMMRYEAPDDFGLPETAFNICAFWRLDALAKIGRTEEAREILEALLASRNHVGLLSEDTDPKSGELWGNFPQTYSMVGIINGATRLSRPWEAVV